MISTLKQFLQARRKGQAGFEWFIICPLFLVMLLCIFVLWTATISNVTMTNTANEIAQNLNLRKTGITSYKGYPTSGAFVTSTGRQVVIHAGSGINRDYMAAATDYLRDAINKGKFDLPVSRNTPIDITVSADAQEDDIIIGTDVHPFKPGSKIFVVIHYNVFGIDNQVTGRTVII